MLSVPSEVRIFLFADPVDMRKSFEGLSGLISTHFSKQCYFLFLNCNQDKLKVLYWDGDGLAIWYKRLEKGSFSRSKTRELARREFLMLLEGISQRSSIVTTYTSEVIFLYKNAGKNVNNLACQQPLK